MRPALAAIALVVAACGPPSAPRATADTEPAAPRAALHAGPLTDYVPAAGLRWLVVGRPSDLASQAAFAQHVAPLLPSQGLDAYANWSGVDLRLTPSALAAGFDYGTLYAAETPTGNEVVGQRFTERLVTEPKIERPHPELHTVFGVIGRTPAFLVRIDDRLVAVAVGDPTPARVVALFAQEKLRRSPPALVGAALSTLPPDAHRASFRAYFPGPFAGEWTMGARGLLATAAALAIAADPSPSGDEVRVRLWASGDWKTYGSAAASRLADAWDDLASSSMGRLLGLDEPASAPVLAVGDDHLKLEVSLRVRPLVAGLHAAVSADVRRLLAPPGPADDESPPIPAPPDG